MGLLVMSEHELHRVQVLSRVLEGDLRSATAASLLGLSHRQVQRLLLRYRRDGAGAVRHGLRGRPSNNRISPGLRDYAVSLVKDLYPDFGPTLAAEKLVERHALKVSAETLRKWMIASGLWQSRAQRRRIHSPRLRRERYGELVQIDGSDHRWFEDRAPPCTLLVFIDDATSTLMQMRFVPSESTFSYFNALEGYLAEHGRPVAFYSDKHSIFRVAKTSAKSGYGMTQFGRALAELNIEILCASSSQAKGRVERANRTLQDRLVKELRLAGISDMETANAFLPSFMAQHNARFACLPARPEDLHRAVNAPASRVQDILCWRDQRYVGADLAVNYERKRLILDDTALSRAAIGNYVETYAFADGRIDLRWSGVSLCYRTFDKDQRVTHAAVVENKRLGAVLAYVLEQQASPPVIPSAGKQRTRYTPSGKRPVKSSWIDKRTKHSAGQAPLPAAE